MVIDFDFETLSLSLLQLTSLDHGSLSANVCQVLKTTTNVKSHKKGQKMEKRGKGGRGGGKHLTLFKNMCMHVHVHDVDVIFIRYSSILGMAMWNIRRFCLIGDIHKSQLPEDSRIHDYSITAVEDLYLGNNQIPRHRTVREVLEKEGKSFITM